MDSKRNTLKKIAGFGVITAVLPNTWTTPIIKRFVLPAHAQTSATQSPTVSGISCSFDTSVLGVDSVITLEATINDIDTLIENITWTIRKNGSILDTGTDQFVPYNYTVLVDDIGTLTFELEVVDDSGNSVSEALCEEEVLGTALLHISAVLPNPVGGDCGPDSREMVSITNSGTADLDLTGFTLDRVKLAGPETLISLGGVISVGQTIDYDVCQGTIAGTSAVLNNTFGGVVRITDSSSATIDIVQYPPIVNGPAEGSIVSFGPTPSTTTPRPS